MLGTNRPETFSNGWAVGDTVFFRLSRDVND
jgi:hypothetical protein